MTLKLVNKNLNIHKTIISININCYINFHKIPQKHITIFNYKTNNYIYLLSKIHYFLYMLFWANWGHFIARKCIYDSTIMF